MYIEIHDRLGSARRIQCTRVVVCDDFDNPISLSVEYEPGMIISTTAEHPDFNRTLYNLGINKVVVARHVRPNTPLG